MNEPDATPASPSRPVELTTNNPEQYAHIEGWGVDLDHANRPAYPRERKPPRLEGVHWLDVPKQEQKVKVFHSTERDGLTPVFGTSVPPSGFSGLIRSFAFRYSENDLRHWLLLFGADRVHVGEGVVSDLFHGRIPNVYSEMGGKAEMRLNPRGAQKKALIAGVAVGLAYLAFRRRRK